MVATPTESTIRSICSEDKMVPVCTAIVLILSVGGVFYFFGDKKQAEILPVAKYEVQLPVPGLF